MSGGQDVDDFERISVELTISVKIYILHLYASLWDDYWIEVLPCSNEAS